MQYDHFRNVLKCQKILHIHYNNEINKSNKNNYYSIYNNYISSIYIGLLL